MRLSKDDLTFVAIMLLIMLLLSWGLYDNIQQRIAGGADFEPVGSVEYKRHVVMRKYGNRFVWENVNPLTPVYLYDSILTKDKSDAIIKLKNGVTLELDPNTMVEIDMVKGKTGLKLRDGIINAENTSDEESFIETLMGETLGITSGRTKLSQGDGELNITVKNGKVRIGDQDLEVGDNIEIDDKGNQTRRKLSIFPLSPLDGHAILTDRNSEYVTFKWRSTKKAGTYRFLYSRNPSLNWATSKSRASTSASTRMRLATGVWYWKVVTNIDGKEETSSLNTLKIVKAPPVLVFSPAEGETIAGNTVTFKWQRPQSGASVNFILAKDAGLKNRTKSLSTTTSVLDVRNLSPGTYYWRVKSNYGGRLIENRVASPVYSFHFKKRTSGLQGDDKNADTTGSTSESNLIVVEKDTRKDADKIKQGRETLSWRKNKQADTYQVDVADDRNFQRKRLQKKTKNNYVVLPKDLREKNRYYWRVEARDKEGKQKARSRVQSFTVVKKKETLARPARLSGPVGDKEVNPLKPDPINFSWQRVPGAERYLFQMIDRRNGRVLVSRRTQKTGVSVTPNRVLLKKRLAWRVRAEKDEQTRSAFEQKYVRLIPPVSLKPPKVINVLVKEK